MKISKWTEVVRWSLAVAVAATAAAGAAWADDDEWIKPWTSVGSAGSVNPAHIADAFYGGPTVGLKGSEPYKTAIITYNVVAVDGMFNDSGETHGIRLRARFTDPGPGFKVTLRLYERSMLNGLASKLLLTLDSDSFPGSLDSQDREVSTCSGYSFDFSNRAYYVVAILKREIESEWTPQLHSLQVASNPCVG